jgi:hypothetical protein
VADYFYSGAPSIAPRRSALDDLHRSTAMLLPLLQKMDEEQQLQQAARSPFVHDITRSLMEPVAPPVVNPSFNQLTPGAVGSYNALSSAVGLPQRGGGGPPPPMMNRAPQAPQQPEQFDPATLAALKASGVDPSMVGETAYARSPFHVRQLPPQPRSQAQLFGGPHSAADMKFFGQVAPYIAQRRVAQEQARTGLQNNTIKGEYGEQRAMLRAGVDLTKAGLEAESRIRAALARKPSPGSEAWKQVKGGLDAMRQVYGAEQAQLGKLHDSGFDTYAPGTPERDRYEDLFARSQGTRERMLDYESRFTSMTEKRVGKIRGEGRSAQGMDQSPQADGQSLPSYVRPLP